MVFDRATLVYIYDVLKEINENENRVSSILLNHTSKYGTKTLPKFKNVAQLRGFINDKYPYVNVDGTKECITCNEGIFTLLRFEVVDGRDSSIIVNNVRNTFEIPKNKKLNNLSIKRLKQLTRDLAELRRLYETYACFPYIQNQSMYIEPIPYDYIEIIRNIHYNNFVLNYYLKTKRSDIPARTKSACG